MAWHWCKAAEIGFDFAILWGGGKNKEQHYVHIYHTHAAAFPAFPASFSAAVAGWVPGQNRETLITPFATDTWPAWPRLNYAKSNQTTSETTGQIEAGENMRPEWKWCNFVTQIINYATHDENLGAGLSAKRFHLCPTPGWGHSSFGRLL